MRRVFWILLIALGGFAAFAIFGPALPETNPLHGFGDGIREVGRGIAEGMYGVGRGIAGVFSSPE